jgi:hypothetical protein
VEPVRGAIQAALGRKPGGLGARKNWTSAERAFISIPGTVRAIAGVETARQRPYMKDLFFRVSEGSQVKFPENNVTKCGTVITAAPDREQAVEAAEEAARSVLIRLEPGNRETAKFLAPPAGEFPPGAFTVSEEIRGLLARLPDTEKTGTGEEYAILPFPEFTGSGLRDYMGRTVEESLEAARLLTGLSLPPAAGNSDNKTILGRSFWAALIRGGYQGAAYLIDSGLAERGGGKIPE